MNFKFPFLRFPNRADMQPPIGTPRTPVHTNKTVAQAPDETSVVEEKNEKWNFWEPSPKVPQQDEFCFDIFGIKLYYDDILIIALILFLYNEGVDDSSLFIALTLLLLS